jgi:hypothetical protein
MATAVRPIGCGTGRSETCLDCSDGVFQPHLVPSNCKSCAFEAEINSFREPAGLSEEHSVTHSMQISADFQKGTCERPSGLRNLAEVVQAAIELVSE